MIFNKSTKLILGDRMGAKKSSAASDFLVSFFSGVPPTLAEFTTALNDQTVRATSVDNTPGRIGTMSLMNWLDTFGTELAQNIYATNSTLFQLVTDTQGTLNLGSTNVDLNILAQGTAGFFAMLNVNSSVTNSNYRLGEYEVFNLFIGTIGTAGSGADMEVVDPNILLSSVIKPGVLNITY